MISYQMIREIMIITPDTIVCQKNLKAHYLDYHIHDFKILMDILYKRVVIVVEKLLIRTFC